MDKRAKLEIETYFFKGFSGPSTTVRDFTTQWFNVAASVVNAGFTPTYAVDWQFKVTTPERDEFIGLIKHITGPVPVTSTDSLGPEMALYELSKIAMDHADRVAGVLQFEMDGMSPANFNLDCSFELSAKDVSGNTFSKTSTFREIDKRPPQLVPGLFETPRKRPRARAR